MQSPEVLKENFSLFFSSALLESYNIAYSPFILYIPTVEAQQQLQAMAHFTAKAVIIQPYVTFKKWDFLPCSARMGIFKQPSKILAVNSYQTPSYGDVSQCQNLPHRRPYGVPHHGIAPLLFESCLVKVRRRTDGQHRMQ